MREYGIEYKSGDGWYKACEPFTDKQRLITDYKRLRHQYKDGIRRAFVVSRTPVSFEETITIKENV